MQRQNPAVRQAVLAAAVQVFAARGYEGATMPEIARRAGTATGNVYRYFPGKKALYAAVLPRPFVTRMKAMMRRRVLAYDTARHVSALDELVRFTFEHRDRAVLLLGSHARMREQVVSYLVGLAVQWAKRHRPRFVLNDTRRFALEQLYDNLVVSTLRAFNTFPNEADARTAIEQLTRYHLGGLERFFA
jgi:AcrR family transcriptional regulator